MGPAADALHTPGGPLLQNLPDAHDLGHTGNEDIEVAGEAVLQGGEPEQLLHQLVRFGAPLQVNGQLQAIQVCFVPHIGNFLQLAGLVQLCHLIQNDLRGGGIGNLGDFDDVLLFHIVPLGPELEAATAGGIDLPGSCLVKEQLCTGGKIGAGQGFQNVVVGIVNEGDGRFADLPQVERANVAGHAHGNALVGRNQHIGESGRQQHRLQPGGIVVIHHVHRVHVDIPEELGANGGQLGFGITGSRIGHIPGVDLAEVTFGFHKGVQQCLVTPGQTDHGFIDGGVAVGIQLHGLTHDVGGLG